MNRALYDFVSLAKNFEDFILTFSCIEFNIFRFYKSKSDSYNLPLCSI